MFKLPAVIGVIDNGCMSVASSASVISFECYWKTKQTKKSFTPGGVLPAPCSVHYWYKHLDLWGWSTPLYKPSRCVLPPPFKGMVFAPCWSENGYTFCPFWSGIGYGLRGNYGSVWTYLLFQIQMNTGKERLMYVDFKKSFILCSNLSNDDIIS